MQTPVANNEVLVRFAKYGKWELLDAHIEDDADLQKTILEKFPDKDFIAMRVGETEAVIKRNTCEN